MVFGGSSGEKLGSLTMFGEEGIQVMVPAKEAYSIARRRALWKPSVQY
jgi:hypothetical protein